MQDGEMIQNQETVQVPADEWTAAALAHASILLTLILGVVGGIGVLVGPAIALAMYFGYRAVLAVWVTIAWTVSGVLSAVLVGLLMMPFALLMTLLMVLLLVGAPLAWLGYGLYASYQVYQGRNFYYQWIGEWIEREVKL
jgi:hypothetical protein